MSEVDLGIAGLSDVELIDDTGGFASVYSAVQTDLDRPVAVKVLRAVDDRGRRWFDRERRTMARTTGHGNIVTVFDSGYTHPSEQPYLVMEYMPGGSLQQRLDTGGPLGVDEAIELVCQVADGLGYAHQLGVVHKDIKPANILLGPTGAAKLSDFGIASIRDQSRYSELAFSLVYAPPETFDAVKGDDGKVVDPRNERSDLYSLAATLYTLVTGQPPFDAASQASLINLVINHQPEPTGHPQLDAFLAKALAKNPTERHRNTDEFITALRPVGSNTTLKVPPPDDPPITSPRPPSRRGPVVAAAGLGVVAIAAIAFTVTQLTGGSTSTTSTTSTSSTSTTPTSTTSTTTEDTLPALDLPITYTGHTGYALCVTQLDNGLIATCGGEGASGPDDDTVQIWDPADPDTTLTTYTGHTNSVVSVIQLDDGLIASASVDDTVQIWDPANPDTTLTTYTDHTNDVYSVIQLDNGLIASASRDDTVQIWDPADPDTTLTTYTGHTDNVWSVIQLDDGLIASASWDGTVQIWDPADPDTTLTTYTGHTSGVRSVIQLDDGLIASASWDDTVQIWDPADPDTTLTTYTGHTSDVLSVIQLDDGLIASASSDETVQIWDPADPDTTLTTYTGHTNWVQSVIQLDNGLIASASSDDTVQIWDPANP